MSKKIVLATGNNGKVVEIQSLLSDLPIQLVSQKTLNVSSVEETGTTYVENAIIKARHAAAITGLPALADDSGISVQYLKGAPGVYSARYAGEDATDQDRIQKLLHALETVDPEQRQASFHCVIAYMRHADDPAPLICHGIWHGRILTAPQGSNGFGYDPIFYDDNQQCSAAELDLSIKNTISHRGQAIAQFQRQFTC